METRDTARTGIPLKVTLGVVAAAVISYQLGGNILLAIVFALLSAAGLFVGGRFRQYASVGFVIAGVVFAIFVISALL